MKPEVKAALEEFTTKMQAAINGNNVGADIQRAAAELQAKIAAAQANKDSGRIPAAVFISCASFIYQPQITQIN